MEPIETIEAVKKINVDLRNTLVENIGFLEQQNKSIETEIANLKNIIKANKERIKILKKIDPNQYRLF